MITYIDLIKRLKGTKITRIFISTIVAWCPISHGISSKESFCLLRLCSFDRASLCLLCFLLRVKSLYKKNKEFKTALITSFILLLSVTEIIYAFCVNEPFHYICSKNICHNIFFSDTAGMLRFTLSSTCSVQNRNIAEKKGFIRCAFFNLHL